MRIELEVKDSKATFVLELLKNFTFIKTKQISPAKEKFINEFEEAIEEMKLIDSRKKKGRNLRDVLNEI
ncbi:MAG: hypothetical protein ABI723_03640 [Bacteroidia bacterium]